MATIIFNVEYFENYLTDLNRTWACVWLYSPKISHIILNWIRSTNISAPVDEVFVYVSMVHYQ